MTPVQWETLIRDNRTFRRKVLGNNIRDRFKNFRRRGSQPEQLQQLQTDLLAESALDSAYIILIISSCALAKLLRRRSLLWVYCLTVQL
jgi:hypothetical protein